MNAGSIPAATSISLLALVATSCLPDTYAYLTVPVTTENGDGQPLAIVDLSLAELAARADDFDRNDLAVYHLGRHPIAHTLVDTDGNGTVDHVRVKVPIPPGAGTELVVTSPGPRSTAAVVEGGSAAQVVVRYERIRG